MVHLCSRISNDLDIFRQELVAVLSGGASVGNVTVCLKVTYEAEQSWELESQQLVKAQRVPNAKLLTVFFFARSPEAPRTTITVLSFNSMFLVGQK
jgi:hypothetical protein